MWGKCWHLYNSDRLHWGKTMRVHREVIYRSISQHQTLPSFVNLRRFVYEIQKNVNFEKFQNGKGLISV